MQEVCKEACKDLARRLARGLQGSMQPACSNKPTLILKLYYTVLRFRLAQKYSILEMVFSSTVLTPVRELSRPEFFVGWWLSVRTGGFESLSHHSTETTISLVKVTPKSTVRRPSKKFPSSGGVTKIQRIFGGVV